MHRFKLNRYDGGSYVNDTSLAQVQHARSFPMQLILHGRSPMKGPDICTPSLQWPFSKFRVLTTDRNDVGPFPMLEHSCSWFSIRLDYFTCGLETECKYRLFMPTPTKTARGSIGSSRANSRCVPPQKQGHDRVSNRGIQPDLVLDRQASRPLQGV
jgi:hypothetical protein